MAQMFIYKGKITRVTAYGVWAEVPALATDFEFGPLETLKGVTYEVDDRIAVGQLAGVSEDLIALGKIGVGADEDVIALLATKSDIGHTHNASDVNAGVLDIARIPVAPSGTSNTTQVVRADDARLSDARTPSAHQHSVGDLTATGTRDSTTFLRGDNTWAVPSGVVLQYAGEIFLWPVGDVHPFALPCDGQTFDALVYPDLAARLGTNVVPDIRGRVVVHQDGSQTEFDTLGEAGGAKTVTLTAAQSGLPAHSHQTTFRANATGLGDWNVALSNGTGSLGTGDVSGAVANTAQNASQAHENMPPYRVMRYMIRTVNGSAISLGAHNHDASVITSGTLPDARLPVRLASTSSSTGMTNYNTVTESGFYVMDSAASNAPVAATCYLEVRAYSTTYVEQVARHVVTGAEYRRYMTAGNWGAWDGVWLTPTLQNTWVNYSNGYALARYRKQRGVVYLQGLVAGGTSIIFNLPAGFRPVGGTLIFTVTSAASTPSRVDVDVAGNVTFLVGNNGYVSLAGISFPAEA
jgi:microcystin-dependent protein